MVFPFTLQWRPAVLGLARDLTERKRAAAALQESEERYHSLFNSHRAVMLVLDPETGGIVDANPAACRFYGYSLEVLLGKKITDINILPADEVRQIMGRAKSGQQTHFIFHHQLADGAIREVEVYTTPIAIGGKPLLYSIVHDITDRQRAEAALQESNERYRRITQAVTDYFYTVRVEKGYAVETHHGPGCVAVTGYTYEEFAADPFLWLHMVAAEDRPLVEDQVQRLLAGKMALPIEHRIIRKDGALRWVRNTPVLHCDEQGRLSSYDGLIQDVTERKQVEEALIIKESAVASAINAMAIAAFGGKLTYVNRSFLDLWGYEAESEVLGKSAIDFWPSAGPASQVMEALTRQDAWFGELVAKRKDGSVFDAQVAVNVVKDKTGRPLCMMGSFADITTQKRAGEEIQKLNAVLEQRVQERTAQLEATVRELEAFASSVSHDLRAPLRAMAGYSQALVEDQAPRLDAAGRQSLEQIGQAVQRMDALITGLLELSRLGRSELQREVVDLSALARAIAVELYQREPGRQVKLVVASDLTVQADHHLMRVVLENLLDNAWKFTSRRVEPSIGFGAYAGTAGERVFFVRDNGAGFDMAHAGRLFGPFQRLHTQDDFQGIGIGLATVRRIIERHGGRVWAEGAIDQGATFYFTL
jgi:PAS domain S-box-containing protein